MEPLTEEVDIKPVIVKPYLSQKEKNAEKARSKKRGRELYRMALASKAAKSKSSVSAPQAVRSGPPVSEHVTYYSRAPSDVLRQIADPVDEQAQRTELGQHLPSS